jgi:hypothetical protein
MRALIEIAVQAGVNLSVHRSGNIVSQRQPMVQVVREVEYIR